MLVSEFPAVLKPLPTADRDVPLSPGWRESLELHNSDPRHRGWAILTGPRDSFHIHILWDCPQRALTNTLTWATVGGHQQKPMETRPCPCGILSQPHSVIYQPPEKENTARAGLGPRGVKVSWSWKNRRRISPPLSSARENYSSVNISLNLEYLCARKTTLLLNISDTHFEP